MKRWKIEIIALASVGAAWFAYFVAANPVARWVHAHFDNAVRQTTHHEVTDVAAFTVYRLHDCVWLLTLAIILGYTLVSITRLMQKTGVSRNWRWIVNATVLFISINFWLSAASHTALFWCAMFQGFEGGAENFGPFNVKYYLLKESSRCPKAVIMGNSQANRQFQTQLLNSLLEPRLETGELHWPGSQGYDIMLVHRRIEPIEPKIIICYVSEGNFYGGASGESIPVFFHFSDLPDCRKFSLLSHMSLRKVCYGLLSDGLPAYALRDTLAQRILGKGVVGIKQRQVDENLGGDLEATARRIAPTWKMDANSDFQKKAFAVFVEDCVQHRQKLVIIAGQLNPILGQLLSPEMRADMLTFLHSLYDRYPENVFLEEPPFQPAEQYVDLTHVSPEQRKQFTCYMARRLEELKLIPADPKPTASLQ